LTSGMGLGFESGFEILWERLAATGGL